jgi:hypothetical protein
MLDQLPAWARFVAVMVLGCALPLTILFGAEWAFIRFARWYDKRIGHPRAHTQPNAEQFIAKMKRKGFIK